MSPTEMLAEFHAALSDERGRGNAALRATLHQEEHRELMDELIDPSHHAFAKSDAEVDRAQLARELADVVYVAFGTAHAFAIDLDVALAEIHRAAMEKLRPKCQRCDGERWVLVAPLDLGSGAEGEEILCSGCGGTGHGPLVVREDGKILKPPGFVPPDMSAAVRERAA
jgi:NTP pyrophosphatase (non-canonical NTP hydrolase)